MEGFKGINPHYLRYQCSKYGLVCLFGNLGVRECRSEPYFVQKENHFHVN